MAENPKGISEAEFARRLALPGAAEVTEGDVGKAAARAFGRDSSKAADAQFARALDLPGARASARRTQRPGSVLEGVIADLSREAVAAETSTPWRDECPWAKRDALRNAEEHLARLYSSRRGESLESAQRTAQRALREAWEHPGGLGLTSDQFDAVVAALDANTRRLEALTPISSTTEAGRKPGRMIDIVKEPRQ